MITEASAGARVRHAEHGEGTLGTVVRGGRAALVRFDALGALDIQVPTRELVLLDGPDGHHAAEAAEAPHGDARGRAPQARLQLLEALRLGTVPASGLELYTVGRETELSAARADLARTAAEGGAARVFLGDYGTGKTHLLECIAHEALEAGFLVARTALDPVDVPASHPRRVYAALVGDLAYPGEETRVGLRPLLERVSETEAARERLLMEAPHAFLTPALKAYEALHDPEDDADGLLDWLEGSPQAHTPELNRLYRIPEGRRLPALMDFRPWARIYAYIVSGLAGLARSAGYEGLVLLLDEGELFHVLSAENRGFAIRLFRALVAAAVPRAELPFDPDLEPRGGAGRMRELPHRDAGACPLYVVLAMTPTGDDDVLLDEFAPADVRGELTPLTPNEFRSLAHRVVTLYAEDHARLAGKSEALADLLGDLVRRGLDDGTFRTPRMAVKFIIDLLDMARVAPERVRPAIEEVKRLWMV